MSRRSGERDSPSQCDAWHEVADLVRRLNDAVLRTEHIATQAALGSHPRRTRGVEQLTQHLARLEWRRLAREHGPLPNFDEVEFRMFSQNGEDGIIWYLMSLLGDGGRRTVELSAGDGTEACSTNLIVNHGWEGLLVDGDEALVQRGQSFFADCGDTWYDPPRFVHRWITAENVNELLEEYAFADDLDLLVVDVDGNDYWIWQAISARPRVVVIEANELLGTRDSVTVPYDPGFRWQPGSPFRGASLRALVDLGARLGYRLVGVERYGFNAFFVRADCGAECLPTVSVEECVPLRRTLAGAPSAASILADYGWTRV